MGNRAVVTFDKKPTLNSVGVYLHWQGGPESIRAFADALNEFKVRTTETDPAYELARFVQIVANYIGGTESLGVGLLKNLDLDNGDNGVYRIYRTAVKCEIEQSASGDLAGPWFAVGDEVLQHDYFKDKDAEGNKRESIRDGIRKAQGDRFSKP